jgi:ribonuclease HI
VGAVIHGSLHFDGGVRGGNPGHAGFAAVVRLAGKEHVIARPMRGLKTNNDAEYTGLIVGIKYAAHLGVTYLDIYSDSKLVVEQVNGNWRCDSETMRNYRHEARKLLNQHFAGAWSLEWLPRLQNITADAACAHAVQCSLNPWKPNKLDPFHRNKPLVRIPSRVRART